MRLFLLLTPFLVSTALAGEIRASADFQSSSEPVSVSDMVNGWSGDFTPGTYAYANGELSLALTLDDWTLSAERRWYYYFEFSRGMSIFYHNQEQGLDSAEDYDLELDAKSFYAEGGSLAKTLHFGDWQITPAAGLYRIYDYQFGELNGVSEAGSGLSASATLDYHFSEDKILEYPVSVPAGTGYTFNLGVAYQGFDGWQLEAQVRDLFNRWQMTDAGYTEGCINLGSGSSVCSSSGSASGRSGTETYNATIPATFTADAQYTPMGLTGSVYWHGRYHRLSVRKDWQTFAGDFGVSAHSTRQLGLHWSGRYGAVSLESDDQRLHSARDLAFSAALQWQW